MDILALKIEQLLSTKDVLGLRRLVEQAKKVGLAELASADVKVLAVLRESEGVVNILEKSWEEAEASFKQAFQLYHESGHNKTRDMLVLQSATSILCENPISPFSSPEAQMLLSDEAIGALSALWNAHFERSHREYLAILEGLSANEVLKNLDLIGELQSAILTGFLGKIVSAYKSLSLDYLAKELKVPRPVVQQTLFELILDKKIDGTLDEVAGLYVRKGVREKEELSHIDNLKKVARFSEVVARGNLNLGGRSDLR